jgi:hypothetical protein
MVLSYLLLFADNVRFLCDLVFVQTFDLIARFTETVDVLTEVWVGLEEFIPFGLLTWAIRYH